MPFDNVAYQEEFRPVFPKINRPSVEPWRFSSSLRHPWRKEQIALFLALLLRIAVTLATADKSEIANYFSNFKFAKTGFRGQALIILFLCGFVSLCENISSYFNDKAQPRRFAASAATNGWAAPSLLPELAGEKLQTVIQDRCERPAPCRVRGFRGGL
jgi:hypothetical protein